MEIALKFPDARGCGQIGTSCEFCDSRKPWAAPDLLSRRAP